MSYRELSTWNEANELRCLLIFKKLQAAKFKRGMQMDYCRTMSAQTQLDAGSISAKVSNYKSVAGVNGSSHASSNTKEVFKLYGNLSIQELVDLIDHEANPEHGVQ